MIGQVNEAMELLRELVKLAREIRNELRKHGASTS